MHACYTKVSPSVAVDDPQLVVWSESVAELLDLDNNELVSHISLLINLLTFISSYFNLLTIFIIFIHSSTFRFQRPDFPLFFSGASPFAGAFPYAQCYGGHQFGMWAGQLGDGRAITLGEILNYNSQRWELQLKGAGKTPYSRFADGLAVLRSSVREFLCSEAMHHLGIPTTRALSLVTTGKLVTRDMFYEYAHSPFPTICHNLHYS